MHKSPHLRTLFFKFAFTPIMLAAFSFISFMILNIGDESAFGENFMIVHLCSFAWSLIWLIVLMIQLQSVETHEEYLLIKNPFRPDKKVYYKDVEWVYDMAWIKDYIGLQYKDKQTLQSKKIIIMHGETSFSFNPAKASNMCTYIRQQCKKVNTYYMEENEPNKWKPMILVYATAIPIQAVAFYYFF